MQVRVLGPVDVVDTEGNNLALRGPMPTRVLAVLAAIAPEERSVDDLVADVWAEGDLPADPVATLRTLVARIRSVLGPGSVVTGTGSYRLGDVGTDAIRFEELVARARRASGSPAVADLWRQALDLWRGPAFGDQGDADPIRRERNRLEELRAEATEAWFDARLAAGEGRELAADLDAAVDEFPLREGFRAQQMTVLARAGRQAEALRAYQDFRGDLTEIGLEPSIRLAELEGQIAVGDVPQAGARRTLRGYELGDHLGEGAFAIVHEARQASVDRPVAIKQIRGSLADQPEFIRQFEAEAHLVARLEHPHIVPLYDYWREPGSAYLVMRYLDGGSLQDRLAKGPLPVAELATAVSQVAAGLDEAHQTGVIHRDVKPANILLDTSGNAYLSDFGIAVEEQERLDPEAWLSNGSPAYAAPEQLRREAVGPPADVYALGVTAYEALTDQLPFPGETTMAGLLERQLNDPVPLVRASHPDVPAAVDTVIQKATKKDAASRYQSAGAFAADLAAAAGMEGDAQLIAPVDRNPYKGLRAFDEADAADFAGRDRLVRDLIDAVAEQRVVMVVGPSGSGKSSAVRAGLLPRLRNDAVEGSRRWFVTTMIPGADPFADLEAALTRVAVDPPPDLATELRGDEGGLARMLDRLAPEGGEVVLVIDQFEELFTLADSEARKMFLDGLVLALGDGHSRLRVVATLRADFYDQPLRHPAFAQLIQRSTVPVHPLTAEELERAITQPAQAVGASFEPGLVAEIAADVADQPGALPLLQYALTELYDRRVDDTMTRESYEELGRVAGALARRAEEVYHSSTVEQQDQARRLFGRLVTLGEGVEDTRRRALRSELGTDQATTEIIERFGRARLLSFDRNAASREQTVEIAHEALIREWLRLREWMDRDREGLRILRHLTQSASEWHRRGRQSSELYRGGRLETAHQWAESHPADLNPQEREYLDASQDLTLETERMENQRLEDQVRTNKRLRRFLTAAAIALALAMFASVIAFQQRAEANRAAELAEQNSTLADEQTRVAQDQRDLADEQTELATTTAFEAEQRRMASDAERLSETQPELALLLASEVHRRDPGASGLGALQRVLARTDGYLGSLQSGSTYIDGALTSTRVLGRTESGVEIWDMESRALLTVVEVAGAGGLVVSSEQQTAFTWDPTGAIYAINIASGLVLGTTMSGSSIGSADLTSTGDRLVVGRADGSIEVLDVDSMTLSTLTIRDTGIQEVLVGPGDDSVISWEGFALLSSTSMTGGETLWETPASERLRLVPEYEDNPGGITGDEFSEGAFASFLVGEDAIFVSSQVWRIDSASGEPLSLIEQFAADGADLGDGRLLLNGSIVDGASGENLRVFGDSLGGIEASDVDLAAGRILSVNSRTLSLWSLDGAQLIARSGPGNDATQAYLDPDGKHIVGNDWPDGRFTIWDLVNRQALTPDLGDDAWMAAWMPSGGFMTWHWATLETGSWDSSFNERRRFPGQNWGGYTTGPDDKIAVIGTNDLLGGFSVYVGDGQQPVAQPMELAEEAERRGHDISRRGINQIQFSPDGQWLAVRSSLGLAGLYDTADWTFHRFILPDSVVHSVAWSGDSTTLAVQTDDSTVNFLKPDSLDPVGDPLITDGNTPSFITDHNLAFGPEDQTLVVGYSEGAEIWDLESRQRIGGIFPNENLFSGSPSFDGRYAVTSVGEHLLVWDLDYSTWPDIACRAAGRNLTLEEWEQSGPSDTAYRATCPQWPPGT